MIKSTLALFAVAASLAAPAAQASLSQTLVLSKSTIDSSYWAATAAERSIGYSIPAMAMTVDVARFLDSLQPGQLMQCNVTALKQAAANTVSVWSIYGIDSGSCKQAQ